MKGKYWYVVSISTQRGAGHGARYCYVVESENPVLTRTENNGFECNIVFYHEIDIEMYEKLRLIL